MIDFSSLAGIPLGSGLTLERCNFIMTGDTFAGPDYPIASTVRLGTDSPSPLLPVQDVSIRNCTFSHNTDYPFTAHVVAFGIDGLLIENNVFDLNASGRFADCAPVIVSGVTEKAAIIHLGTALGQINATNVTIRGNQIDGSTQVGIYSTTGALATPNSQIVIEDNNITAAEQGILFENTISSEIKGNHVAGVNGSSVDGVQCATGVGIELAGSLAYNTSASSACNAILKNTVTNNGRGIVLDCGAKGNLVQENDVFNNSIAQIVIKDRKNNVKKDNTTFKRPCANPCNTQSIQVKTQAAQSAQPAKKVTPKWHLTAELEANIQKIAGEKGIAQIKTALSKYAQQ